MTSVLTHAAPHDTIVSTPAARAIDAVRIFGSGDLAVCALDHVNIDIATATFTAVM